MTMPVDSFLRLIETGKKIEQGSRRRCYGRNTEVRIASAKDKSRTADRPGVEAGVAECAAVDGGQSGSIDGSGGFAVGDAVFVEAGDRCGGVGAGRNRRNGGLRPNRRSDRTDGGDGPDRFFLSIHQRHRQRVSGSNRQRSCSRHPSRQVDRGGFGVLRRPRQSRFSPPRPTGGHVSTHPNRRQSALHWSERADAAGHAGAARHFSLGDRCGALRLGDTRFGDPSIFRPKAVSMGASANFHRKAGTQFQPDVDRTRFRQGNPSVRTGGHFQTTVQRSAVSAPAGKTQNRHLVVDRQSGRPNRSHAGCLRLLRLRRLPRVSGGSSLWEIW